MASFARSTFAHATYASFRPTYPRSLFRILLGYHHHNHHHHHAHRSALASGTLLDLGCGHGLISRELAPHFTAVHAIDPAEGMVAQAKRLTADHKIINIRQGHAEDLSFLPDRSVDMVVAGQAAHWFNYDKVWPELSRVVRQGGTLAFWGYKDHVLVGHPQTSPIFDKFIYGEGDVQPGMESLARFWEDPGRTILRESFRAIVPPDTEWQDVKRIVWDPDRRTADVGGDAPEEALWLRKGMKLGELEGYVRTYSSFNNWKLANPDMVSRADGGAGDVVDYMFDEVVDSVDEWKAAGDAWRDIEVDAVWGTVILMARRR